ncbi:hypothetical protein [Devosia ginsengisoli]|uniref:MarR family transcriptional regulator n=1 Tax=Devosia ginsengisoli TaxID=400770 RepID=A0A5B8LRP5_9HYPH|nr:hypothetical protein [Devosia ginsengisoli]QDZ10559.1 hypothetical protein FPZ08_07220 [Devosia ginsengisoli]
MRKLTDQERQLLRLIADAGGSICPGVDTNIPKEGHKSLRRMERAGLLTVEDTDDGPRFKLTILALPEVDHG